MGNHFCCDYKVPSRKDRHRSYRADGDNQHYNAMNSTLELHPEMSASSFMQSEGYNLQHISDREPENLTDDPSLNPTKETLFLKRSLHEVEQSIKKRRSLYERNLSRRYACASRGRCYSSTCTLLLDDSTVSRPNAKSTVRALATAVYCHIRNRQGSLGLPLENGDSNGPVERISGYQESPEIFDEQRHPIHRDPVPSDYATRDPDQRTVYRFIKTLFHMAQLSPECAIVTMVYLERFQTSAEVEICPGNWKRILLCAILLASKVWDDQAVWNVDFCQILRDLKVDDVNELERQFLEILQFNTNVPSSVYAKYYFDIRALSDTSCHPMPLSWDRAYKLEAMRRICEDPFRELVPKDRGFKRSGSLDTMTSIPRFRPAILP